MALKCTAVHARVRTLRYSPPGDHEHHSRQSAQSKPSNAVRPSRESCGAVLVTAPAATAAVREARPRRKGVVRWSVNFSFVNAEGEALPRCASAHKHHPISMQGRCHAAAPRARYTWQLSWHAGAPTEPARPVPSRSPLAQPQATLPAPPRGARAEVLCRTPGRPDRPWRAALPRAWWVKARPPHIKAVPLAAESCAQQEGFHTLHLYMAPSYSVLGTTTKQQRVTTRAGVSPSAPGQPVPVPLSAPRGWWQPRGARARARRTCRRLRQRVWRGRRHRDRRRRRHRAARAAPALPRHAASLDARIPKGITGGSVGRPGVASAAPGAAPRAVAPCGQMQPAC